MKKLRVPLSLQKKENPYCGPHSLKMILSYYKKPSAVARLVKECKTKKTGTKTKNLIKCGENNGLYFLPIPLDNKKDFIEIVETSIQKKWPIVISLDNGSGFHACVLRGYCNKFFYFSDPVFGFHKRSKSETWVLAKNRYALAALA